MVLEQLPERMRSKIIVRGEDECWGWAGATDSNGYAITTVKVNGVWKNKNVTRVLLGLSDRTTYACHKCDNPRCVNPSHLFAGNNSANILDAVTKGRHGNASKPECPQGHSYSGENLVVYRHLNKKSGNFITHRVCKKCMDIRNKLSEKRRKENA